MDLVSSKWLCALALLGLTLFHQVCTQNVFVAAPNTFRIGEKETVVVYSHSGVQMVTVSLTDSPGKKKVFYSNRVIVVAGIPQTLEVKVDAEHIPDLNITGPTVPHYVSLMVQGNKFILEKEILVTLQSGYVFIQTDKPIYNPSEKVNIRIIRLDESMASDKTPFTLQIRNPQNTIVDFVPHKDLQNNSGMYIKDFKFPNYPLYGEWSVVILYGLKVQLNSTVKFELRQYVLPTFEVKVKVPEVILPDNERITVSLLAEYVYGKKVSGKASIKLKVKIPTGHTEQFGSCDLVKLDEGKAKCEIDTKYIKDKKDIGWFPGISGSRLVVEAVVSERSSGYKENRTTDSTVFAESPYVLNFGKSLTTYIAGLDTVIMAQVNHVNGNPADKVEAEVTIRDQNNSLVKVEFPIGVTNNEGLVAFEVKTNFAHSILHVIVETKSQTHPVSGHMVMLPFKANGDAYVGIRRVRNRDLEVGKPYSASIYNNPLRDMHISFMVISKGKVVTAGSILENGHHEKSLNFMITADMVPSARVVIFAMHNYQLLSDSLKIRVEKVCSAKGNVKVELSTTHMEPGSNVTVKITGKEDTVVGILAVDKAVYALRNKDRLTRDKMFSEMEKHDMGCGAGGGLDSAAVLANAGIILMTDTLSLDQERKSCVERKLRKRAINEEITRQHGQENPRCCDAGQKKDIHGRTCDVRAEIIRKFEGKLDNKEQCADDFLSCCLKALSPFPSPNRDTSENVFGGHGRNTDDQPDDVDLDDEKIENILQDTNVRKDFRETWLFNVDVIDSSGVLTQNRNVPDSITTWIVQVVSLTPNGGGMCVAEPIDVVVFKNFFLDVKVPHSVVRNEQIEIPVTIFNYGSTARSVYLFSYGNEGICSDIPPGKRSEKKKIVVKGNSAETLAFQMIPLEVKQFQIKFSAVSSGGGDTVVKKLNVIAEGVPHEETIQFIVDPTNTERRAKRSTTITREKYEVDLQPKFKNIVPGTQRAVIEAIGDKFGPTVHTSLNNPDEFLRLPFGCGEQNMACTAPTVYTLHYLKATGKMTAEQETNGFKYMKQGYSRQQTYRKPDGSFAVWHDKPSSTWLTAFVAKVFCQAGRHIFVDENVICGALKWLVIHQKPDGTFEEKYFLHHQEMKGGITGDVPLTSFVVMALSQCQCKSQDLKKPTEKAVEYLKAETAVITDYYNMAISTYALALYDKKLAIKPNEKLLQMSTYEPVPNWRYWGNGESPISIEASSYALLTQILLADREHATSVVNFLNSQRKFGGSFYSTQDTVAAIEALSEYAILSRDPDISLAMNLTSTSDFSFNKNWQFQSNNARVRRQVELNSLGGRLLVAAEGSGVGQFGVTLRYNIANSPDRPALCQFDMSVDVSKAEDKTKRKHVVKAAADDDDEFDKLLDYLSLKKPQKNDSSEVPVKDVSKSSKYHLNITVCSRYLKNQDTNMAIVDVGMLTGFKPNIQDLKDLVRDSSSLIDRFEESGRNLIFYLEKIPSNKSHCFSFRIIREFLVSNLESGLVRVYDYYNPDDACSQLYRSESLGPVLSLICVGSICKCANGGCAKDPYERIKNVKTVAAKKIEVATMVCNEHDYFFKVQVNEKKAEKSGNIRYDLRIVKVLKEGREKRNNVEDEVRKFIAADKCERSNLFVNETYYLMGRDQEPTKVGDEVRYVYLIDESSTIQKYWDLQRKDLKPTKQQKNIQYIFSNVESMFNSNDGCND